MPTGSYEITSYTSDGTEHLWELVAINEPVEGMVIEKAMRFSNVVIRNNGEEHIIICVLNEDI